MFDFEYCRAPWGHQKAIILHTDIPFGLNQSWLDMDLSNSTTRPGLETEVNSIVSS